MSKREEFLKRILETFKLEAQENINSLYDNLIKLEKESEISQRKDLIEQIYRSAHSLKGASRAVNLQEIERVCHAFEDVMAAIRDEIISVNSNIFDVLHKTVDLISLLVDSPANKDNIELEEKVSSQIEILGYIEAGQSIEDLYNVGSSLEKEIVNKETRETVIPVDNKEVISNNKKEKIAETSESKSPFGSTIRVSNTKLDSLLFQTEELLEIKLAAIERKNTLKGIVDRLYLWEKDYENYYPKLQAIKRKVEDKELGEVTFKKEDIADIVDVLEWAGSSVKEMNMDLNSLYKTSSLNGYNTALKIDRLMGDVKNIITVPFSSLSDSFPKMVRDVSKDLGKNVDFNIVGGNIEIDRRVLEKIKDPLIHILRNALDYGVESSTERIKNNKPFVGKITLEVERLESNNIRLLVEDDGRGINIDKLKSIIADADSVEDIDTITKADCLNYIFKSGISTSDIVTDISGRGVGLAIVWDNIDQLGGKVSVETENGKFTRFIMNIPSSLITYRGIVTEVSGNKFIVPTSKVEKVLKINKEDIKNIKNKETISYGGNIISVVRLSDVLNLPEANSNLDKNNFFLLVLNNGDKNIAFIVDAIEGEREILVKKFNKQLSRVRYFSGATTLGSGKVIPILNISDLFKSALNVSGSRAINNGGSSGKDVGKKSVLIVEDSVTSRMLLKNILESSGYAVDTAIDGIDGFTRLMEKTFDAVVSDVEMPRMNGFQLTEKIRDNETIKDIPVVLVTSLSKREHKERGIDVGANAYVVKSSFDNSNLLEILERLI